MELTPHENGDSIVLEIAGKCTVEHAATLRDGLLAAVNSGKDLSLDISRVEEVDITFLQLLLSAALTLERGGRSLACAGKPSATAMHAARVSGFNQPPQLATFFADEGRDG